MKLRSTLITLLAGAALLLAVAGPAAAAPQYPAGWPLQPGGLRQIALSTGQRALCKGPSGTVYEVSAGYSTDSYAAVEQVRVASGTTARWWTYPATAMPVAGSGVIPVAAASDAAGDLYLAGEVQTPGDHDWVVLKFSSAGKRLWKRSYDSGMGDDTPTAMCVDHTGGVIVAGTSEQAGGHDGAVIKWSSSGRLKWTRFVSASGLDLVGAVAVDASDNVYAAGQLGLSGAWATAFVRSWTPGGRQRWSASVAGVGSAPAWRCLALKGSAVYVAGQSTGDSAAADFMAMSYTTSGKPVWPVPKTLASAHGSWVSGLAVDRDGAALIVGTAYDAGAAGQDAGQVWKLGPGGATAWSHLFGSGAVSRDGELDAVGVDRSGRVYAAGGQSATAGAGNLVLVRYSSLGDEEAYWKADAPASGLCAFDQLLVLDDTRVIAAGEAGPGPSTAVLYRAKTTP
jgi:hypothetical protein